MLKIMIQNLIGKKTHNTVIFAKPCKGNPMNKNYILTFLWLYAGINLSNHSFACQTSDINDIPFAGEKAGLRRRNLSKDDTSIGFRPEVNTIIATKESANLNGCSQSKPYTSTFFSALRKLNPWAYEHLPQQENDNSSKAYKKLDGKDLSPIINSKEDLRIAYDVFLEKKKIKPRTGNCPDRIFEALCNANANEDEKNSRILFYQFTSMGLIINKDKITELWELFQRFQKPEPAVAKTSPQFFLPSLSEDDSTLNNNFLDDCALSEDEL